MTSCDTKLRAGRSGRLRGHEEAARLFLAWSTGNLCRADLLVCLSNRQQLLCFASIRDVHMPRFSEARSEEAPEGGKVER
jgi:hypothetical protein